MKTETYFLANGDVVELPFEPDDAFILRQNDKLIRYQIKDNIIFIKHDNGWYETNKIDAVNALIEEIQAAVFHLDNVSNKHTIGIHELVNAANILNNIKRRAADDFDWNNDQNLVYCIGHWESI